MQPQGLIFDFDGTLVDTMPIHWHAWEIIAARHGMKLSRERLYSLGGVPSRNIIRMLAVEQGLDLDHVAIAREKELAYLARLPEVKIIPEVVGIAHRHFEKLPMAIATGGTRQVVEQVMEHLGLRHLFQSVVTSEDVVHQKPAPDIFLEAARRISVAPVLCRAYEDTVLGMQAIRAAGMEAVDVRDILSGKVEA
jgi:beta-phosphoglucomutase-like phosphatase (HAD superfamily)